MYGELAARRCISSKPSASKLISALLFAAMSALVRLLGDVTPVGQMVFFRSAFAIVPVVVIYAYRGELAAVRHRAGRSASLGRGLLSVGGMFTNFSALTRLPLADATAISFASPLITVALAAVILKERVRIYRWTAVLVGFFGVIVMLIPHFDLAATPRPASHRPPPVGSMLALTSRVLQCRHCDPDPPADAKRNHVVDRVLFLADLRDCGRADAAIRLAYADLAPSSPRLFRSEFSAALRTSF